MPNLERALQIAVRAHAGARDKAGEPYIFHPIRVMIRCRTNDTRIAALLHDVIEDTEVSLDDLRHEGFEPRVLRAVQLLTHDEGTPYHEYVERISRDPVATEVKLADLEDNLNLLRLPGISPGDLERLSRYRTAHARLMAVTGQE